MPANPTPHPNTLPRPGQRWVSDNEPELGLGIVTSSDAREGTVDIRFPATGDTRRYATRSAPLRRVRFAPGDRVRADDGGERLVTAVDERDGLIFYQTDEGPLPEGALCGAMSFSKPEDRLLALTLDEARTQGLRAEALEWRARIGAADARGFAGARVELLPHQLFIAAEVCAREHPRVLLADEVGLGKTIEACLIVHRLILTGRAARVLVLVPEPLCHQWFVELLRRFNLKFALFDEERCMSITRNDPAANPFLENQWVLAATGFLAENPARVAQAAEAGWDVLVIDEAHHLGDDDASWNAAAALAAVTPSLLLLTATPLHGGPRGHFRRLALLDPDRHGSFDEWLAAQDGHEALADTVEALAAGRATPEQIAPWVALHPRLRSVCDAWLADPNAADTAAALIERLLDGFGVGRVMFRNTRARLGGFPRRVAHLATLAAAEDVEDEWHRKAAWIAAMLESTAADEEKLLVICHERVRAEWLAALLAERDGIVCALFHEGLSLLQRDRNAAWFAEPEGARVLVCSETGSEGRNFQFARHLVLADLPPSLDLLEQRIGRLDRIGRRGDVLVHVPVCAGSADEIRARWIQEGLDGFANTISGCGEIERELGPVIAAACDPPSAAALNTLLPRTRAMRDEIAARLARGEERLLAMRSHNPQRGATIVETVRAWDDDGAFRDFAVRLFEHVGLRVEDLGGHRWFLRPEALRAAGFPELPEDGLTVTFGRRRALERENEGFLTLDHPMLRAALDTLLGSEQGNAGFAAWESGGAKRLILECRFVAAAIAPPSLHHERFLPPTPLRVLVDHHGRELATPDAAALDRARLLPGDPSSVLRQPVVRTRVLPAMLEAARSVAAARLDALATAATTRMFHETGTEIDRLLELAEANPHVTPEEIARHHTRRDQLNAALATATLRLDSLRLIWHAPHQNPQA